MNLRNLYDKYDQLVAAVAQRLRDGGHDPNMVLISHRALLTLDMITATRDDLAPMRRVFGARRALQTSLSIDELADDLVAKWRAQKTADESI